MDKYQNYLFKQYFGEKLSSLLFRCCPAEQEDEGGYGYCIDSDNNNFITIKQDDDITKTKYVLLIKNFRQGHKQNYTRPIVSGVSVFQNNQWSSIPLDESIQKYRVIVDFNNRIQKIRLSFLGDLVDNFEFDIKYQEADTEKYHAKKEQERINKLLEAAAIKCSTGADLVNIYFQPCNDNYARTEIVLYRDEQMLAKYKVDEECFFKSITGLAYGLYKFVLKQYGKNKSVILESDPIFFKIEADTTHFGGKPIINL